MLYFAGTLLSCVLAILFARHLVLGERYSEWQARRQVQGRMAGYPAFLMFYGNPLFDGESFLEWRHPSNRRRRAIGFMVLLVFVILFGLFFWLTVAAVASFGVTSFGTK